MKIALFHNVGAGGAKRQIYEQVRGLVRRGHIVDLFTTGSGDDREEYLPLAPLCHAANAYGGPGGLSGPGGGTNARPSAVGAVPPSESGWKRALRRRAEKSPAVRAAIDSVWVRRTRSELAALSAAQRDIAQDIDAADYDIAYICQCRRLLAPEVLPGLRRTPALFCCNDTLRAAYEWAVVTEPGYDSIPESLWRRKDRGRFFTPPVLALDRAEERRFVANTRAAGSVLANSRYTRDRLLTVAGVPSRVCYPGVDTDFFAPDPAVPRDRRLVVSVGALTVTKRHEAVLRAAAHAARRTPASTPLRVEILGYEGRFGGGDGLGPEARRLCALAGELNVALEIRRDVTDIAVRDAYRRAGAVAFAPYLEPLGLVPLEAMACGAAVVGVAEAGIRETIRDGETGLLTDLQPETFGAALARVLADTDLAAALGARGREAVLRDWTWDRSVDGVEEALRETAARPNSKASP